MYHADMSTGFVAATTSMRLRRADLSPKMPTDMTVTCRVASIPNAMTALIAPRASGVREFRYRCILRFRLRKSVRRMPSRRPPALLILSRNTVVLNGQEAPR